MWMQGTTDADILSKTQNARGIQRVGQHPWREQLGDVSGWDFPSD